MARKIIIGTLAISTVLFAALSFARSLVDYNENGKYFDGLVVYDVAELEVFVLVTLLLFASTVTVILVWKKSHKKAS
jgi:hypothetical protein